MRSLLAILLLAAPALAPALSLKPAFGKTRFEFPTCLVQSVSGAYYVCEQAGRVQVLDKASSKPRLFLDLRGQVRFEGGEEGLLCMALDPKFSSNGAYYLAYSVKGASPRRTRLSRFSSKGEEILFEVSKKHSNHNGATVCFGPDGLLYLSLGDGGGWGDQDGNARNPASYLGKVLRFRVDGASKPRPEIFASGLRNTWRMSFDRKSGELWGGDVGQDKWEEIDVIRKGGDYGWNAREGSHRYNGAAPPGAIEPVLDYGRDEGSCVTGGYVYRGSAIPSLQGNYVFGDFASRRVWSHLPGSKGKKELLRCPESLASFAEDQSGELLLLGYEGTIYYLLN
jgi:glucose/arabinose dehydrogenase